MVVTLNQEESEKYFYNALCNGASYIQGYGLEVDCNEKDYKKAKKTLQSKINDGNIPHEMFTFGSNFPICKEDVWMEVLRNDGTLKVIDHEGNGEYTRNITLKNIHERVQKTPLDHLNDMIKEQDDAVTADVVLQTVFFEEIVFG